MWSTMLSVGGWISFYLFIIFYVRWVCLERMYFIGMDPEGWVLRSPSDSRPGGQESEPVMIFPLISSLGRPA